MKISIITISFNSENTIEETIKSIINQKYQNLEYIIIDGGSTDSTISIIEKYKTYINKVISENDNGISDAFNKGIRLCTGDLIGIINSDDLLQDRALEIISNSIEDETDVLYGNIVSFNNKSSHVVKPDKNLEKIRYSMLPIKHPSTFIRKQAYEKYGVYDLKYRYAMDLELLSRLYLNGAKFQYIDNVLAMYRTGGENQKNYLRTLNETRDISIKNGFPIYKANILRVKNFMRFYIVRLIEIIGIKSILLNFRTKLRSIKS